MTTLNNTTITRAKARIGRALGALFVGICLVAVSFTALAPRASSAADRTAAQNSASQAAVPNPMGCQPGEIFTDMQGWWKNPNPSKDRGHLHIGVCFPHGKTLTGKVTFRIRTVMHNNPGRLTRDAVYIVAPKVSGAPTCGGNGALACVPLKDKPRTIAQCAATGGTLSADGLTCTWWDNLTVDTALIANDGWQEFRFKGYVKEPDGQEMIVSNGLHAYLKNGRPVKSTVSNPDGMVARGWYTDAGYTNAALSKPPMGPVSGTWTPSVKLDQGSGGLPVIGFYCALDPDFHNANPGTPVKLGNSLYRGKLQIDTTKLSNGWHRLFLKTDALHNASGSTSSGVLAILFEVQN
jgi:hypothetical protein